MGKVSLGTTTTFTTATAATAGITVGSTSITLASATPTITGAATATAFTTTYGTASVAQQFNVSGANMSAGITVTPPVGFEVSTSATFASNVGTSASPITVGGAGTISSTPIYVRLAANAAVGGTYNSQNIVLSSSGAANVNIVTAASGNAVTAKALTITGVSASNKTYDRLTTATLTGTPSYVGLANNESFSVSGTASASFADKNVGTGKTVTVTGYTAPSSNYTVTQPTLSANITARSLTVTATGANKEYDRTNAASVSYTDNRIAGDVFSVSGTATFDTANVGTAKTVTVSGLTITGTDAGNYSLSSTTTTTTADITAKSLTPTATATSKTYDGLTSASVSVSLTGVVSGDTVTATGTGSFADANAGTGKTVSVSGIALGGADASNYALSTTTTTTTADITPAALAITGVTADNKTYNGNTTATLSGSPAYAGLVNGETFSVTGTPSATFASKSVGSAKTVTVTGYTAPSNNYTVTQPSLAADITAATLTVTATGVNKPYDGTNSATVTYSDDRISGDVFNVTGTATFDTAAVASGKTITVSSIAISGADAGNYTLANTSTTATADITKKTLTVSATASDKVYNATTAASVSLTLSGVIPSESVTATGTGLFTDKNVGTNKTVNISGITLSGNDAGNYTVPTTATASASITALSITGSITANDKVFDGTNTATIATRTLDGVISGDTVSYDGGTATFDTSAVGTNKTVTATGLTLGGADAGNYTVNTTAITTANITAPTGASQTITFPAIGDKRYGDTFALNATSDSGLAVSYTVISGPATISGNQVTVTGVGSVVIEATQSGDATYAPAQAVQQSFTANAAQLTATISASNKTYDGTNVASVTYDVTGKIGSDVVTASGTAATFSGKNVGTGLTVTATGITLNGADAAKYVLVSTTATTTANITAKALAATITASSKVYNASTAASVTYNLSGVIPGESVGATGTATFDTKNVGTGKTVTATGITLTGADAGNYTVNATATTTADITVKSISVTGITAGSKTYDGNTSATLVTSGATLIGVESGDTVTLNTAAAVGTFATASAGSGKVVNVSGLTLGDVDASNYSLAAYSTTADIAQKSLTVSISVADRAYDATTSANATYNLSGIIPGDSVTASGTAVFADKNVGTGKTVTATGITLNGAASNNYSVATTATTTASITAIALTSTVTVNNKPFDNTTSATIATRSLTGVLSSDVVSLVGGTATFATATVGTAKSVSITGLSLGGADAGNYTVAPTATASANITANTTVTLNRTITINPGQTIQLGSALLSATDGNNATMTYTVTTAPTNGTLRKGATTVTTFTSSDLTAATTAASGIRYATTGSAGQTDSITVSVSNGAGSTITGVVININIVAPSDTASFTGSPYTQNFDNLLPSPIPNDRASLPNAMVLPAGWTHIESGTNADNGLVIDNGAGTTGDGYLYGATGSNERALGSYASGSSTSQYGLVLVNNTGSTINNFTLSYTGELWKDGGNASAVVNKLTFDYSTTATSLTGTTGYTAANSLDFTAPKNNSSADATLDGNLSANQQAVSGTVTGISWAPGAKLYLRWTDANDAGNDDGLAIDNLTFSAVPTPTVTVTAPSGAVYDGTAKSATASVNGVSSLDGVAPTLTYYAGSTATGSPLAGAPVNAGTYTVVASYAGSAGFTSATSTPVTYSIAQATLTLSATAASRVYDASTNASASVTLSGVISGDVVSASFTSATFANKNVGTGKTVTVSGITLTGAAAANYTVASSTTTTADITTKALTASITTSNKVYDGSNSAVVTYSLAGVEVGDVVSASGSASFADKNVGTGKTVSAIGIALSGGDAANYTVNDAASTTADITAKSLAVTISGGGKVYDATAAANVTYSLTGVIQGDVVNVAGTASYADKNVGATKTITASGIAISGADAANYTVNSTATTTAAITAASLTVSITAASRVYDGSNAASATYSVVGTLPGDTVTASGTATFADKMAGTGKTVTATVVLGGIDAGNYIANTTATASADITAKAITGSITVNNKTYDGTTSATIATRTLNGTINGDDVIYTGGTATFATSAVGTGIIVTATGLSLSGADAGNYTVNDTATTTADITTAVQSQTITFDPISDKTYGDAAFPLVATSSSGLVVSFNVVSGPATISGSTLTITGAGTVVVEATQTGNAAFTPASPVQQSFTVAKKVLTPVATATSKDYDGTPTATVSIALTGLVNSDNVTASGTGLFSDKNAASGKTVSVSGITLAGPGKDNYTVASTASTTADINKKTLVANPVAQNKVYDRTVNATVSITLTGVVDGEVVTATGSSEFVDKNVGTGKTILITGITLGGGDEGNYAVASSNTASADITAKQLTAVATASNKIYDGTTDATVSIVLQGVIDPDAVTASGTGTFINKNVGSAKSVNVTGITLTGDDASNYTVAPTASTTANITAKSLTPTATATSKVYDASTSAVVSITLDGVVAGESIAASGVGNFVNKNVGTGKTVNVTAITLAGAGSSNYTVASTTTTTADISAKEVTATATATNKVYDGSTSATVSISLSGVIDGDLVTATGTGAFDNKNVATGKAVSVSGITLNGDDAANYSVAATASTTANVTAKALTPSATATNKVYDGTSSASVSITLSGVIDGDVVTATGTGAFNNKNVGTGKTVNVNGITLSGADAVNYIAANTTTTTANITALQVTAAVTVDDKNQDGTTAATIATRTVVGAIVGDSLTLTGGVATFASATPGTNKTVTVTGLILGGADAANYSFDGTATTTATINASNLAPVLTSQSFAINSKSLAGAVVGTIVASDPENAALTFSIPGNTAFGIDSLTGRLTVVDPTKLPAIPRGQTSVTATLPVTVSDGALSTTVSMSIVLSATTRQAPRFANSNAPSVLENNVANFKLGTISPTATYTGQTFGSFAISGPDADAFSLTGNTIFLKGRADFETKSSYVIIVSAADSKDATKVASTTVTISVRNVNEAPTISAKDGSNTDVTLNKNVGTITIDENVPGGTTQDGLLVGILRGADVDVGTTLDYSVTKGTFDNGLSVWTDATGAFTFNPANGEIRVKNAQLLSFEKFKTIKLEFKVVDDATANDTKINTVTATLNIALRDLNEKPIMPTVTTFSLAENNRAGATVTTIRATDPDTGAAPRQTLTYAIVSQRDALGNILPTDVFAINPTTGALTVTARNALDFETNNSYSLVIRATDNGTGNLSSDLTVTVNVLDVNEAPVATLKSADGASTVTTLTVAENSAKGTVIGKLIPSDVDLAGAQAVTVTLSSSLSGALEYDPATNEIKVLDPAKLNFEAIRNGTFTITATLVDAGTNASSPAIRPITTRLTYTVNVTNVNEAPTNITFAAKTISGTQAIAVGNNFGKVTGVDPDAAPTLSYSLVSGTGDTDNSKFVIDSTTGVITNISSIARKQTMSLLVRVTDQGGLSFDKIITVKS